MKLTYTTDIARAMVHGVNTGKTSFTLQRKGTFKVAVYGVNHCGTSNPLEMAYTLVTRCSADSLDSRGFLFDQTNVDRFFQSQTGTDLSCEEYAVHCGRELYRRIRRENAGCKITFFALTLSPAPFMAQLTFTYEE